MDKQTTTLIANLAEALAVQLLCSYTHDDVCHMTHLLKMLRSTEIKLKSRGAKVPYAVSEVLRMCSKSRI